MVICLSGGPRNEDNGIPEMNVASVQGLQMEAFNGVHEV